VAPFHARGTRQWLAAPAAVTSTVIQCTTEEIHPYRAGGRWTGLQQFKPVTPETQKKAALRFLSE
jgi:hypothetical protein